MAAVSTFSVDELGDFLIERAIPASIVTSFTGMPVYTILCFIMVLLYMYTRKRVNILIEI